MIKEKLLCKKCLEILNTHKECTQCKELLPFSYFYKKKYGKFRLSAECKKCHNKMRKEWEKKNIDKRREYTRKYQQKKRQKNSDEILQAIRNIETTRKRIT